MKRILLDMSAILWQGLKAGVDSEFGREVINQETGKVQRVNGWQWGYDNAMSSITTILKECEAVPRDVIMVWDGEQAKSFRQVSFDGYKAGRNHAPEEYEEWTKAARAVEQQLLAVGASSAEQFQREADDVIAYLAKSLSCPVFVCSTDNDLAVLQGGNVTTRIGNGSIGYETNYNKYGIWPARFITLYKALVGDTSDNIKGVRGFGETAFGKVHALYGDEGLEELCRLLEERKLDELADNVAECKVLSKVLEDKEGAYLGWKLAKLYPEAINTGRCPLTWRVGMVKAALPTWTDERLQQWAGTVTLGHKGNFEALYQRAKQQVPHTSWYALDIETSASDESDEWIEALKKNKSGDDGVGIDVYGHNLTGLSVTFGDNGQHTVYLPVDHAPGRVANVTIEQARDFVALFTALPCAIHNAGGFELPVLERTWGAEWQGNGWHGFVPHAHDTSIMSSYVDENLPAGLKKLSAHWLGYTQTTYDEVTQGRRMRDLTADEVLAYGADDTICTAALYQFFRTVMDCEKTWDAFEAVEILPAYLTAKAFNQGQRWSLQKVRELEQEDQAKREKSWEILRDFLIAQGWEGSICPEYNETLTPSQVKEAFSIVTGSELTTQVRTVSKLAKLIDDAGYPALGEAVRQADLGNFTPLNGLVKHYFDGEPKINFNSPNQVATLLYGVMGLPVRLRNRPTDAMKASVPELRQKLATARLEGKDTAELERKLDIALNGNPQTDDLAVEYAMKWDAPERPEIREVLRAYQTIRVVDTKTKMFYKPYRYVQHWTDNLVRPQYRQSATVTRRHNCSAPNEQQMPKHPKHGEKPRLREAILPHHDNAVVVSLDFSGQELRVIADESKDPDMLACFIGDNKRDMHSLTSVGIVRRKAAEAIWRIMRPSEPAEGELFARLKARWAAMDYDTFVEAASNQQGEDYVAMKDMRALGKKTNFTTEYGAQAAKLAETLLIDKEEAQAYIDAKEAAFPVATEWKRKVIREVQRTGFVTTKLGARRHLANALFRLGGYEGSRAERQAVNFKIQSSSAEMTKLAMARCWKQELLYRFDCRFIGPIHDELVWSVNKDEVAEFIRELNALMTQPYADMQVPIVASISLGANFGEQIECGDEFDAARIQEAIATLFPQEVRHAA